MACASIPKSCLVGTNGRGRDAGMTGPPTDRKLAAFRRCRVAGRKIRDEADALSCLDAVRRAGGDASTWARTNGVDGRSLYAWTKNLVRQQKASWPHVGNAPKLVELVPAMPVAEAPRYVLDLGSARLLFSDDFSTDTLRRVLDVVRAC